MLFANFTNRTVKFRRDIYWNSTLLLLGLFAFCWMSVIPFGDELQQFPRALHTLDPAWLSHDLFVGAPQGDHWVFFRFLGGLFWLAGPVWGAVLARIVIWLLLAGSLISLGRALNFKPLAVILGTALFIAYNQSRIGGETIVGEAIARHLAYPLVLFALSGWIRGRFMFAAVMLGFATAVHVLVGGWATATILGLMFFDERVKVQGWPIRVGCAGVCLVFSLPGLIPILPFVFGGSQSDTSHADQVFIYFRHSHHLSPGSWPLLDYLQFAGLFAVFVLMGRAFSPSPQMARLRQFVWVISIVTALALAVGLTLRDAFFLKLHPYRFAPPLTALMVGIMLGQLLASLRRPPLRWLAVLSVAVLAVWLAPRGAYHLYQQQRNISDVEASRLDALRWLRLHARDGATVLANPAWADVQWETRCASVTAFKLVPFEASRINEWYRRLTSVVGQPPWSQPGHITQYWIQNAYDAVPPDQLVSMAGQLEADFVIAPAPCIDSDQVPYSNSHYCVYATAEDSVRWQNYLVVRYDDYTPISPYEGPPRQIETEKRLFDLAAKYSAKVSVGVVPFPITDPNATARDPSGVRISDSWLSDPGSPWVQLLRQSIDRGVAEPALHGFEHRKRTLPGHRPGEYRAQPPEWQRETLRLGHSALVGALQVPVRVFIPPWNSWDAYTIEALGELDYEWLSPDQHQADYAPAKLKLVPQCTADPAVALASMEDGNSAPSGTVLVLVAHPFDFETPDARGDEYFQALERVLAHAEDSPNWTSVGFTDLPRESPASWNSRFRAAVQLSGWNGLLKDVVGDHSVAAEPTLYRPLHWYQDHLWRLRLSFSGVLILAASIAAAVSIWLALWSKAGRLLAWFGLFVAIVAALYLGMGAWRIAEHDYAVRGVRWLAISAAAGTAIGFAYAAIRRRRTANEYPAASAEIVIDDRTNRTIVTA